MENQTPVPALSDKETKLVFGLLEDHHESITEKLDRCSASDRTFYVHGLEVTENILAKLVGIHGLRFAAGNWFEECTDDKVRNKRTRKVIKVG